MFFEFSSVHEQFDLTKLKSEPCSLIDCLKSFNKLGFKSNMLLTRPRSVNMFVSPSLKFI